MLRALEHGRLKPHTRRMEMRKVIALQEAWQRAVNDHAAFMRDARAAKMTVNEISKRGRIHLLRIDTTFSQLKAAEQFSRQAGW
jgi:hypothetical protein